ncbi:MAG: Hsp70 family protein [Gammaproteobacteria bacterium]
MKNFCGFDFGTSNSTIGVISPNNSYRLIPLENNKPIIRSAIFCDAENKEWVFGKEGIDRYLDSTPGRLMMALKSVLGSPLMNDETFIFNEYVSYADILGKFIRYIKASAEQDIQQELTHVVMGRPVHFHDTDVEKDQVAQNTLEEIALKAGFKEVSFQYEPIAAALAYETTIEAEQLALIVDMGGGTSDFSVICLRPGVNAIDRSADVLANTGIHIAGTDFDHKLSLNTVMPLLGMGGLMQGSSSNIEVPSAYYHDLTTWHTLSALYGAKTITHIKSLQAKALDKHAIGRLLKVLQNKAGHYILNSVESCKQDLSAVTTSPLDLNFIERDLEEIVTRDHFNQIIDDYLASIVNTIFETITLAKVRREDISAIFYTGGSTKIPIIHSKINPLFPNAKIVQGDAFGSVGMGLTIDASRKFS